MEKPIICIFVRSHGSGLCNVILYRDKTDANGVVIKREGECFTCSKSLAAQYLKATPSAKRWLNGRPYPREARQKRVGGEARSDSFATQCSRWIADKAERRARERRKQEKRTEADGFGFRYWLVFALTVLLTFLTLVVIMMASFFLCCTIPKYFGYQWQVGV